MGVHGIVPLGRGVTGELAGVQQFAEAAGDIFFHTLRRQALAYLIFVQLCRGHVELVSHKAQQGLVQLLVESRIEVFAQELAGLGEAPASHLAGGAAARAHNVRAAGGDFAQCKPDRRGGQAEQRGKGPEEPGAGEEAALWRKAGGAERDVADVRAKVAHVLSCRRGFKLSALRSRCAFRSLVHLYVQGAGRKRYEPSCGRIVVAVIYGANGEVSVAAGDEGILERAGTS